MPRSTIEPEASGEPFSFCTYPGSTIDKREGDFHSAIVIFDGRSIDIERAHGAYRLRDLAEYLCAYPSKGVRLWSAGQGPDTQLVKRQLDAVERALLSFGICAEQITRKEIDVNRHSHGVAVIAAGKTRGCTRHPKVRQPAIPVKTEPVRTPAPRKPEDMRRFFEGYRCEHEAAEGRAYRDPLRMRPSIQFESGTANIVTPSLWEFGEVTRELCFNALLEVRAIIWVPTRIPSKLLAAREAAIREEFGRRGISGRRVIVAKYNLGKNYFHAHLSIQVSKPGPRSK